MSNFYMFICHSRDMQIPSVCILDMDLVAKEASFADIYRGFKALKGSKTYGSRTVHSDEYSLERPFDVAYNFPHLVVKPPCDIQGYFTYEII